MPRRRSWIDSQSSLWRARRAALVAQQRVLGDPRDRVQAQAVDAAIHPEADHVVHRLLDLGVVPVEVGLLGHEAVQVVLLRGLVERPRGAAGLEHRLPVVGLVAPDVPVALGVLRDWSADSRNHGCWSELWFGTQSRISFIPRACVSATSSSRSCERAEDRVDVAVVGDVVAEVGHRRGEDRAEPDPLDLEAGQVVELARDALQVTDAIAVGVRERARIDLVDGAPLPPGRLSHARDYAHVACASLCRILGLLFIAGVVVWSCRRDSTAGMGDRALALRHRVGDRGVARLPRRRASPRTPSARPRAAAAAAASRTRTRARPRGRARPRPPRRPMPPRRPS